ncbi:MAG: hypothetical protein HRT66_09210 [Flavobacteriaceae bacterium]|nr:hypothetical protein [Flavobacteriaceae bacterium]
MKIFKNTLYAFTLIILCSCVYDDDIFDDENFFIRNENLSKIEKGIVIEHGESSKDNFRYELNLTTFNMTDYVTGNGFPNKNGNIIKVTLYSPHSIYLHSGLYTFSQTQEYIKSDFTFWNGELLIGYNPYTDYGYSSKMIDGSFEITYERGDCFIFFEFYLEDGSYCEGNYRGDLTYYN